MHAAGQTIGGCAAGSGNKLLLGVVAGGQGGVTQKGKGRTQADIKAGPG